MKFFIFYFLTVFIIKKNFSSLCGNYVYKKLNFVLKNVENITLTFVPAYTCPYKNFSFNLTSCCDNMTLLPCCQAKDLTLKRTSFLTHTISQDFFFLLATLTVLSIFGLIILITCFIWDKCPLYKKFQFKKHYKGHVIEYHMDSDKPNPKITVKALKNVVNSSRSSSHYINNPNYLSLATAAPN